MPNFEEILKNFSVNANFAGPEEVNVTSEELKRSSFSNALAIRKRECELRFKVAAFILTIALVALIYLSIFQPQGIKTFKDAMSLLGGGSIVALVYYILSLRDELTKIKQTTIIASVVDMATLNTMLLTLASK